MTDNPRWKDALLAAAILAVAPPSIGGIVLRAAPGPVRDAWLAALRVVLPAAMPLRRLPTHIGEGRLIGELDLAATLASGRATLRPGLLGEANGGLLVAPMAERLRMSVVAPLCTALDRGEIAVERDGLALRQPASIGLVALDEGIGDEERPAAALLDRLACHVDLDGVRAMTPEAPAFDIEAARARFPIVQATDEIVTALCAASAAFGIASVRAPLLALQVAKAAAALAGRRAVEDDDVALAARLVLAPRATMLPAEQAAPPPDTESKEASSDPGEGGGGETSRESSATGPLEDRVLQATEAAIPAGLLAELRHAPGRRIDKAPAGRSGVVQRAVTHGRPVGTRQGRPRDGARLSVIDTLRAAAPWQRVRRQAQPDAPARVLIRSDDFRITRYEQRTETTAIFVIDASGSTALQRLAEAKGAVELLLADCYIRRDRVALLTFRRDGAEVVLPPTRSLARAKRSLAGLPGGGGTPLAAALTAAADLAHAIKRKGQVPVLILLTDGRANIARDGTPGRAQATADAATAARLLRDTGTASLLIDTAPRPQDSARDIAAKMGARYIALPAARAASMAHAVRQVMTA